MWSSCCPKSVQMTIGVTVFSKTYYFRLFSNYTVESVNIFILESPNVGTLKGLMQNWGSSMTSSDFHRPQTKLREGTVFSRVCPRGFPLCTGPFSEPSPRIGISPGPASQDIFNLDLTIQGSPSRHVQICSL